MTAMFGWGSHTDGQLGVGGIDKPFLVLPKSLNFFTNTSKQLVATACGYNHTLFLLDDGSVYTCGSNEFGQLGHERSQVVPQQVLALETQNVKNISCGGDHNLVITNKGQVFTWGKDDRGQCGRGGPDTDDSFKPTPRIVKSFAKTVVVSVASGSSHSLALTQEGLLYAFGDNAYGQLGLGNRRVTHCSVPERVGSLDGVPLTSVHAGGYHSFAMTKSGAVFGWGKNSFGQLGVCDTADRWFPTLVKALRNQRVKALACGEYHSVALTTEGGVFTFGHGQFGQLGHNSTNNEVNPKKVFELMGRTVTQIAAGRSHTITYDQVAGSILSFGLALNGQLGYEPSSGQPTNQLLPVMVQGPFVSYQRAKETAGIPEMELDALKMMVVYQIFAGGNHSFAQAYNVLSKPTRLMSAYSAWRQTNVLGLPSAQQIVDPSNNDRPQFDFYEPVDHRFLPSFQTNSLLTLNSQTFDDLFCNSLGGGHVIKDYLTTVFSNTACLNGSFLSPNDEHYGCSTKNPGINIEAVRDGFRVLAQRLDSSMDGAVTYCLEKTLKGLPIDPPDVEALRLYLILPEMSYFKDLDRHASIHVPYAAAATSLNKNAGKVLDRWWGLLGDQSFKPLVEIFRDVLCHLLKCFSESRPDSGKDFLRAEMMMILKMLEKLHDVNKQHQFVSLEQFYVREIIDHWDIQTDYMAWYQTRMANENRANSFAIPPAPAPLFCDYSFVFDASAKTRILQTDAMMQMQNAYDEAQRRNIFSLFVAQGMEQVNPMLVLYVTRENIVTETLNQLTKQKNVDFKKPMKVIFIGEEAVDAGGVRKEFFMLLFRDLINPKFGMFKHYEESRAVWFDPHTFEEEPMFYMVGVVCGLAIYNFTIIDLNFPLVLYKRLLNPDVEVSLEDLFDLDQTVASSLRSLLNYDGDPSAFQDTFCLFFEITENVFGEERTTELKPDGSNVPVTFDSRAEYVELYVKNRLDASIAKHFSAFREGFLKVCGSKVLELFQPQELMAMVVGNQDYDWNELEKNTQYNGDFSPQHPTIKMFWKVFHQLDLEAKKKFLLFLTGSDRIPILGMKSLRMVIKSTAGGENYFPVAHTCFNLLDLPLYTNEETLKEKLLAAIEHNQGFSLV